MSEPIVKELYCRISKVDEEKRTVTGIGASEAIDAEGEIFDYDTSKPYIEQWSASAQTRSQGKSWGNIREMHQLSAVGKLAEPIVFDDTAKLVILTAYISDDATWKKCSDGTYTGFSICGPVVGAKWSDPGTPGVKRYTVNPIEFSTVDLPCNGEATFTAVKAGGIIEQRKFKNKEATVANEVTPEVIVAPAAPATPTAPVTPAEAPVVTTPVVPAVVEKGVKNPAGKAMQSLATMGDCIGGMCGHSNISKCMDSIVAGHKAASEAVGQIQDQQDSGASKATVIRAATPTGETVMDETQKAEIALAASNSAEALAIAKANQASTEVISKGLEAVLALLGGQPVAAKSVTPAATTAVSKAEESAGKPKIEGTDAQSVAKSIFQNPHQITDRELATNTFGMGRR